MEMYWNWLVVTYLFLGGLGAGAYLTSFAAEMGWLGQKSGLKKMGYFIGGPIVGLGTALLVFDLGQGFHKPWLLWRLITNMSSVMTWGTIVLAVFIMVGVLKGYLAFINKPAPAPSLGLGRCWRQPPGPTRASWFRLSMQFPSGVRTLSR